MTGELLLCFDLLLSQNLIKMDIWGSLKGKERAAVKRCGGACGPSNTRGQYHLFPYPTAAKSRQSCPTLCDPIDGSPPGSPVPGILQARTLEWVAISFSNA